MHVRLLKPLCRGYNFHISWTSHQESLLASVHDPKTFVSFRSPMPNLFLRSFPTQATHIHGSLPKQAIQGVDRRAVSLDDELAFHFVGGTAPLQASDCPVCVSGAVLFHEMKLFVMMDTAGRCYHECGPCGNHRKLLSHQDFLFEGTYSLSLFPFLPNKIFIQGYHGSSSFRKRFPSL